MKDPCTEYVQLKVQLPWAGISTYSCTSVTPTMYRRERRYCKILFDLLPSGMLHTIPKLRVDVLPGMTCNESGAFGSSALPIRTSSSALHGPAPREFTARALNKCSRSSCRSFKTKNCGAVASNVSIEVTVAGFVRHST